MFIPKKSFNFFFFTFLIFLFSFLLNFNNYIGSKFLFFIFQFLSFALFLQVIKKNNSGFEFFTYFFFLLSFWFKFNCILYFEKINVTEGDFDLLFSNYDNAIIVMISTFAACLCSSFIKEFIIKNYIKENKFEIKNSFTIYFKRYRIFIIYLLIFYLILIWGTNLYFSIYFKGLINKNIFPLIKYFYSWNLTYGLAVITSILIFIDFSVFKNNKIFVLGIFEAFFSQMNIYSRSFLLSFLAYLRGFLLLLNIKKTIFRKLLLTKIFFLILIIFFLSIYLTTKLRNNQFYLPNSSQTQITLASTFYDISSLAVNRWVGIDSLLAVSQSTNLNFNFLLSAWNEKKNINQKSFYTSNFLKRFEYTGFEKENLNIVITPGIVAFLYYSGSAVFVFFAVLILILICSSIEILFYRYSLGNIILANIIGYALAVRFVHFGYLPINTMNFLLSLVLTFLFIYFFSNSICKKINN
jgi:hypothetical protein